MVSGGSTGITVTNNQFKGWRRGLTVNMPEANTHVTVSGNHSCNTYNSPTAPGGIKVNGMTPAQVSASNTYAAAC
jgi:hypothetical protein